MPFIDGLKRFPYHFILLLLFFLSHGYSAYVGLIPFSGMLFFFLGGLVIGALIFYLFKKILRSPGKAGIATTLIFLFYLFYGPLKMALSTVLHPLSHNRVLVPLGFIGIAAAIFFLRKVKGSLARVHLFINCLLIIYLLVDAATIIFIAAKEPSHLVAGNSISYIPCDTCHRPDIYFFIMDEYSGNDNLKNYFHYDNTGFETALKERGFYVAERSSSNYSSTPISVASIFSMDYIPAFKNVLHADDYTRAEKFVDKSASLKFLRDQGYTFVNHSIFNIAGQEAQFSTDILPLRIRLITSKTLWNTVRDDLAWQLSSSSKLTPNWLLDLFRVNHKAGNERLIKLTQDAIAKKKQQPLFIYTHLLMPHWPYSYDSTGKETGLNFYVKDLSVEQKNKAYVQYLVYTNKRMLHMTDSIVAGTNGQAVIIVMSDHGFRGEAKTQPCAIMNNNFFSVYLPGKDYRLFYDSMSNVNALRTLFNTQFHRQFARLPDTCIF